MKQSASLVRLLETSLTKLALFYEQDDFLLLCEAAVRVIIHPRHIFILSTELFWVASRYRRLWKVTINYLS